MRRASVLLQLLLALIVLAPAMAEEHDAIFDTVVGKMCFRDLLRDSGWSLNGPWERAAFVIQQADGSIACQCWPSKHSYLTEQFSGVMPAHTIAIVHTHPVQYPQPSRQDEDGSDAARDPDLRAHDSGRLQGRSRRSGCRDADQPPGVAAPGSEQGAYRIGVRRAVASRCGRMNSRSISNATDWRMNETETISRIVPFSFTTTPR